MRRINLLLGCAFAGFLASAGPLPAAEFRLGVEAPMTGQLARVGTAMAEGINVAVDMFNAEHKGKHTATIATVDDESNPAKAVAAVEQLAPGVHAFTGGYGSNLIGPASETAARLGKVYMTSGGVSSGLTQRGLDTFFRINNGEGYSKAMVGMFVDRGVKSVSLIYSTKEATAEIAQQVGDALKARGIAATMHAFDPAITDFKPILHKIKLQDRPEAIAMVGYENDYVGILRAAQVLKPSVKTIAGVWSLASEKMAKEFPTLVQNVSGTSTLPFPVEFKNEEAKLMADTYQRLYKKVPDYLVLFGYVQTSLLLDAMVRAEEGGKLTVPGAIAGELRKTDVETLIGRVRFDKNGDNPEFSHRMGQHQDGKVVLVWPADAATGPMNFPAVPW